MKPRVKIVSCYGVSVQAEREAYEMRVSAAAIAAKEAAHGVSIKITWLSPSPDAVHAIIEWVEP